MRRERRGRAWAGLSLLVGVWLGGCLCSAWGGRLGGTEPHSLPPLPTEVTRSATGVPTPTRTSRPATCPTPSPSPGVEPACDCREDLYDCDAFSTRAEAQRCYEACVAQGRGDVHRLDRDRDGEACEGLP